MNVEPGLRPEASEGRHWTRNVERWRPPRDLGAYGGLVSRGRGHETLGERLLTSAPTGRRNRRQRRQRRGQDYFSVISVFSC